MKKKQKIIIETNGKWRGTKVTVDGHEIYAEAINIVGSKEHDLDINLTLSLSKLTQEEIKESCGGTNAVGFQQISEEDIYEDDDG